MPSIAKTNNLLKKAYDIFSNRFTTVLLLTLFFYLPFYLIFYVVSGIVEQRFPGTLLLNGMEFPTAFLILNFFILALNIIFSPAFMSSIYILSNEYSEESKLKFSAIIKRVFKMWPILFISTIFFCLIVLASVPIIIVTPFIVAYLYFYAFIVCEGVKNPFVVLMTSFKSLKGSYLATFGIILLVSILNLTITTMLENIVALSKMPMNLPFYIYYNLLNTIVSAYFYVFLALWFKGKYDDFMEKGGLNEY